MQENKSVKISFLVTILFFILLVSVFSVWKNFLLERETKEDKEKVRITATFYPLYIILLNLIDEGEDDVSLSLLTPPSLGCPHDYQLTVSDMRSLSNCDILVTLGGGSEPFLEKAKEAGDFKVISSSDGFSFFDDNPHIWASFSGAIYETHSIASSLSKIDSEKSDIYTKNADIYIEKLMSLKADLEESLSILKGSSAVIFDEALEYFLDDFGIKVLFSLEEEEDGSLSAKKIQGILSSIKESLSNGEKVFLLSSITSMSSTAQIIEKETGLPIIALDTFTSGSFSQDAFLEGMKKNITLLLPKDLGEWRR